MLQMLLDPLALQILLDKLFLIFVNQFQHKIQEYLHTSRLILIKKKANQTENWNLEVTSTSCGYIKVVIIAYLKSFDPLFSPQFFALTPKKLVVATKISVDKDFVTISVYTSRDKVLVVFLLFCKIFSSSFCLENLNIIIIIIIIIIIVRG